MNQLVATLISCMTMAVPGGGLHTDGSFFKDDQGRVVILRGVNVAGNAKVPPFTSMRPEELAPLADWGMNVVRLLFLWEAYEPKPGVYNAAYLDYITALAREAWRHGLYVIVDFHQDAMARSLLGGCGDGFPDWAVPAGAPRVAPDNGTNCVNWGMHALVDQGMHKAWHQFFRGDGGARARFIAMAQSVARHFANVPGIIGYDMLNEPWGDEATEIGAFYEDVGRAIRTVDGQRILFVAPHAMVSGGLQTDLPRPSFDNFAYAPHFYDNWVMGMQLWLGNSLSWSFARMRSKAAEWGVPLFVGEFGAGAETRRVAGYLKTLHERLDEGLSSGAQWAYTPGWSADQKDGWNHEDLSIVNHQGTWRDNFKPRPYPQKIAGVPLHMWASDEEALSDNMFELTWQHDPKLGQTEIYLPQAVFFGDAQLRLETVGEDVACVHDARRVTCSSPRPGVVVLRVRAVSGHKV